MARISLRKTLGSCLLLAGAGGILGCSGPQTAQARTAAPDEVDWSAPECAIALMPLSGDSQLDARLRDLQESLPASRQPAADLERLGWLLVSKARTDSDPGLYKLAQQDAQCLVRLTGPEAPEVLLLRGHILHSLHRFAEAEGVARRLVAKRGLSFDWGLLGDALFDRGRIQEAAAAYQRMVDMKPDPKAYARVAQIRWIKGDLEGAVEAMKLAVRQGSRDPEAAAWSFARLAFYLLQSGNLDRAAAAAQRALEFQADYPSALLALGRVHQARNETEAAVEVLQRAARINPLPEYQWASAEALRSAGRQEEASRVEKSLLEKGVQEDPRMTSLFWATRKEEQQRALDLARRELKVRQDVFTWDALAWALRASGQVEQADEAMRKALAEGTRDARLFLHAGVIDSERGRLAEAKQYLAKARQSAQTLLPIERDLLESSLEGL